MKLSIHPIHPEQRKIRQVVDCLKKGGVIIYPTDTIYGLGCDINNVKAIQRICQIKGMKTNKANLSFICYDLSHLSDYTLNIDRSTYRFMKENVPGPYTFILKASHLVPKLLRSKKRTVGIRVPDNNIARTIVKELGHPILSTSIHDQDTIIEYMSDPEQIHRQYGKLVDMVIDGGYGGNKPSTVIDLANDQPIILRQGKGELFTENHTQ